MPGTAANPSAFDPLADMDPDEPRFTVRGKDPDGPATITEWCRLRRNRAMRAFNAIENPAEQDRVALKSTLEQCREAETLAMEFREWQDHHVAPEGDGRASYNEIERTQDQMAELERGKRLEALGRHVQEGRYHICEVRDGLADMDLIFDNTHDELSDMLERLQQLSDEFSPRRPEYVDQISIPLGPLLEAISKEYPA